MNDNKASVTVPKETRKPSGFTFWNSMGFSSNFRHRDVTNFEYRISHIKKYKQRLHFHFYVYLL